jgi:hypothetical protein
LGHHLHEGDDKEIEVGDLSELGDQVFGNKVVPGVLCSLYSVAAERFCLFVFKLFQVEGSKLFGGSLCCRLTFSL